MVRETPPQPPPPPHDPIGPNAQPPYPAEKARGAEIVLRTPGRRYVFFGALLALFLLVLLLSTIR